MKQYYIQLYNQFHSKLIELIRSTHYSFSFCRTFLTSTHSIYYVLSNSLILFARAFLTLSCSIFELSVLIIMLIHSNVYCTTAIAVLGQDKQLFSTTQSIENTAQPYVWQLPASDRRYNEVCFLTAHNAYAAKKHGFYYAQQNLTIAEQLAAGARALKLEIWQDTSDALILCHRNQFITKLIRLGKGPEQLSSTLKVLKEFLENNPHEILTLFLDNHVTDSQLIDAVFEQAQLSSYILTAREWDPQIQALWPSLHWMQTNDKRLVIFNSAYETDYSFYQWHHIAENQWGELRPEKACKERKESRKWRQLSRHLFAVNYFPWFKFSFGDPYSDINSVGLMHCLEAIFKNFDDGYCEQRFPNFISIDFIDKGHALKHVNRINSITSEEPERKQYFRSMRG